MIVIAESGKEICDILRYINPAISSQYIDEMQKSGAEVFSCRLGEHDVQVYKSDDRWEFYARKRNKMLEEE